MLTVSQTVSILVIFCCLTNYHELSSLEQSLFIISASVGQELSAAQLMIGVSHEAAISQGYGLIWNSAGEGPASKFTCSLAGGSSMSAVRGRPLFPAEYWPKTTSLPQFTNFFLCSLTAWVAHTIKARDKRSAGRKLTTVPRNHGNDISSPLSYTIS